jgi:hypothetical protein
LTASAAAPKSLARVQFGKSPLVALVLAVLGSQAAGQNPWIPPGATVVIVAGLPGDVESEKTYRDQLNSLTELLPQAQTLTDATREKFLTLGKTLAGQTNPVVVIAWGHGGTQGQTPVFHVRGPRLTPADFKEFAARMPEAPSCWLLFFRNSGAFARELAAPNRQIISSEKDTSFNSDPVGMAVFLKILRANPRHTMDSLSRELGRATAAWYEERHLARTEEPTLWSGKQPPRLLAPVLDNDALASEPSEKPEPQSEPALASSAWKDITKVDARDFPDADAVVLRRRVEYTLGSSPAISAEHEEFIQILTTEGKQHGDFDVAYWPPQEDITFLDCEVQQADGKLARLDPDDIHESADESVGDYHTARRKLFSLPGITPGAVLRVHYQTTWRTFPLPHVTLSVPVADELPVANLAVQITVPRDSAFHYAFDQTPARDPEIKQTTYGTTYSWRFANVPAHIREVLAPPRSEPILLLSTFPDWPAFANWYERITRLAGEITPEISAKAAELTRDTKTDREKVQALYHFVTNLRYVAIPLGVNSYRPHAAANVFKNQFGDCKDKANLFNTLLRSQNIQADLVLVPRFSQAHEAVPGLAFNHAISRVSLSNETIWVDTTDDTCPFGLLPPGDAGRNVLVVDGKTTTLTRLPVPNPVAHQLKLHAQIECSGDWPVKLDVTTTGFCDYTLRAAARLIGEMKTTQPLLAMKLRPVAGAFAMTKQSFTPVSALEENFAWRAEGTWTGLNPATLAAPFWLPEEWDSALHARTGPLFLNQGYPLRLDEVVEFAAGKKPAALPAAAENASPPLRWSVQWGRGRDSGFRALLRIELPSGEIPVEQVPVFQRQLRALLNALAAGVNFSQ